MQFSQKLDFRNHQPKAKQYIVPDIHGYARTLRELLHKIGLSTHDELFLLGDYINRGPDSKGVIDLILELIEDGFQVYPLKGNHEDMALNHMIAPHYGMSNYHDEIIEPYLSFFHSLIYYIEMDHYFLSHAGFNFVRDDPFDDYRGMLWTQKVRLEYAHTEKHIIRGHASQPLYAIQQAVEERDQLIQLDNGIYKYEKGFGSLCTLELTEWKLIVQENIG